jgi:hypothetical protein
MSQRDRDRLVVLKKAQKKLITQKQAAEELQLTERQVRRLLSKLKATGDKAVIHGLRGRKSNRQRAEDTRQEAIRILSQDVYKGFGPTLAAEYLASKHDLQIGRESLRQLMMAAGLWRGRKQRVETVHEWRPQRSCRGELVQWDSDSRLVRPAGHYCPTHYRKFSAVRNFPEDNCWRDDDVATRYLPKPRNQHQISNVVVQLGPQQIAFIFRYRQARRCWYHPGMNFAHGCDSAGPGVK